MSCLSAVEAQLPPGFRFHPKDEELICDYLIKWITGSTDHTPFLIEVDLNKCEPWDLPEAACVGGKEWYFYSQRDRKYATGLRTNRATISGYWKATGKDRSAIKNGTVVGMRKTLVFYQGRAPKGRKTDWIMHEFRLEGNMNPDSKTLAKADWVLCRVFYKNRSEVTTQKHEKSCIYNNEISLPQLMEPHIIYNNPTLEPCLDNQYHEQVPCFSNFTQSQTGPNTFPQVLPSTRIMPTNLQGNSCDEKVVKALLSHITNLGSGTYNNISDTFLMMESPSLGERSSDSYLSEVGGLSSIWNQYS